MKAVLLLIVLTALAAHATRRQRQVWNFPDDSATTSRLPSRRTTTAATTTLRPGASTPTPGVIFQIQNCNCPAPPQYNPVCGTDGNTYGNEQKLNCARQCGANVQFARLGVCATPRK